MTAWQNKTKMKMKLLDEKCNKWFIQKTFNRSKISLYEEDQKESHEISIITTTTLSLAVFAHRKILFPIPGYIAMQGKQVHLFIVLGPAETRCCISKDAGFTKATLLDPDRKRTYFCIYFARGCCQHGSECGYFHLVPTDKDAKR